MRRIYDQAPQKISEKGIGARRKAVEAEMAELEKTLDMLRYKCWYYETAISDGGEERIRAMLPDHLPPGIQELYDNGHK